MHGDLTLSAGTLYAFMLVLARMAGAMIFVPLPGIKSAPEPVRAAFALSLTIALYGQWPAIGPTVSPSQIIGWAVCEAALGLAIGLCVAVVLEAFSLSAQVLGLQAGYAYASTIDPNSEADSGILLVFAQLMAGLLFFALGLDREVLRLFALSLAKVPVGAYTFGPATADALIHASAAIFSVGVRLALPVVALLILVDVALALMGRLNQQLQLLTLAFPAKMMTALLVLSWMAAIFPRIMREVSGIAWASAHRILGL